MLFIVLEPSKCQKIHILGRSQEVSAILPPLILHTGLRGDSWQDGGAKAFLDLGEVMSLVGRVCWNQVEPSSRYPRCYPKWSDLGTL